MGNTGIAKMLSPLDNVYNRYRNISEIDLMTADKTIVKAQQKPTAVVLFKNTASPYSIKNIQYSIGSYVQVLLIPDADSHVCSFGELSAKYPGCLAKMTVNGQNTHPLVRYLKRNCSKFYNARMVGAKKYNDNIGIFTVNSLNYVKYFREGQLPQAIKIFD